MRLMSARTPVPLRAARNGLSLGRTATIRITTIARMIKVSTKVTPGRLLISDQLLSVCFFGRRRDLRFELSRIRIRGLPHAVTTVHPGLTGDQVPFDYGHTGRWDQGRELSAVSSQG